MSTESSSATDCAVPYAATALALTVQDWTRIGLEDVIDLEGELLLNSLTERLTSLLLVRAVALITPDHSCFPDLSTSSICRTVLMQDNPWSYYAPGVTPEFIDQLYSFVHTILSGYHHTPYHCNEHAFHVSCSVHKLLDLLLQTDPDVCKTFGIRNDPLAHWSVLFAALIHDVEHKGVPNRQLVVENDPLAVLYNDESVAEQRSLFIGFDQLLRPEFSIMRDALFGGPEEAAGAESYRRFRKLVIGLVLSTDIASPERTQLGKSKWKEAFGDTFESIERKLKHELRQNAVPADDDSFYNNDDGSVSGTPSSSENECEEVEASSLSHHTVTSTVLQSFLNAPSPNPGTTQNDDDYSHASALSYNKFLKPEHTPPPRNRGPRRGSTFSMPSVRRNSTALLQTDDMYKAKFQRRMSSYSSESLQGGRRRPSNLRKRLGIRRSMDLGGEALEMYGRPEEQGLDEPDEFRALVVLETILMAADIAHNLQGWEQMVVWSGRLYLELRKSHVEGRGADPRHKWFENQIGFLESYLLPLAHRLEDTGVFGDTIGASFASIIEQNRDRWVEEGQEVVDAIISQGDEIFNLTTLADERMAIAQQTRLTGKGKGLKFRGTNLSILAAVLIAVLFQLITAPGQ